MVVDFGRYLLGVTAVMFGVIACVWHDAATPVHYVTAVAYIAGGLMLLIRGTIAIGGRARARPGEAPWKQRVARTAAVLFGICVMSFALEQLFFLKATAFFVPVWIPPNPMFVWIPHLFGTQTSSFAWSETIETFAIAASAWIVAARIRDKEAS